MLDYLRVRGLALLDDVSLEFHSGLNVLTGETGAGKSIIIDALSLLRGGRASAELVRDGTDAAKTESQFSLSGVAASRVQAVLDAHEIDSSLEEGLIIERQVAAAGRSRSRVQSQIATTTILKKIGERLIDICSQHESHSLAHVSRHLELLDAYAGLEIQVKEYSTVYGELRGVQDKLETLKAGAGERLQQIDYLGFQIEEIDKVAPEAGESEQLRKRVDLMQSAHDWIAFARDASEILYESDDAIAPRLASLLDRAAKGTDGSPVLAEISAQLESAQVACEEAASAASKLAHEFDIDPEELEEAQIRISELDRLQRKHRCDADELVDRAQEMRRSLFELENAEEEAEQLEARVDRLREICIEKAKALHTLRSEAATRFAPAIERELHELHLSKARIEAGLELQAEEELGPRGLDRVEFLFSANPGEPLAPLGKVASGGELSRVLLALKGVLATGDGVATYVFDEVDAGVGGAVAEAIGSQLYKASEQRQVLCVTHLPQIAAFAHAHYRVEKSTEGGRTRTRVVRLTEEERIEELARMLAGSKVTDSAREHAAELIAQARQPATSRRKPTAKKASGNKASNPTTKAPERQPSPSKAKKAARPRKKRSSAASTVS